LIVRVMAQSEKDYLSMGRQTRIDLALSLDIHRSNAGAHLLKSLYGLRKHGDSDKQRLQDQIATTQFELNKDTNPFFRKYLNERLKSVKWIANHIAELTFIMLWDILSERQPTVKDLYVKAGEPPDGFIIEPRETRRILNEYYGYMHDHPVKWSPQVEKLADDPKYVVWGWPPRLTRPLPSKKKSLKTVGTPLTGKEAFNAEIHLEDFADPYYLERLFAYRRIVLKMLETIKRQTTIRKEFRWLIGELVHSDYALTILFQNAAREVEKRWLQKNLKQDSKVEALYRYCEGFTESEIACSILAYKILCDDLNKKEYRPFKLSVKKVEANALEQITLAALDYANRGSIDVPRWLFSNLLANGFKLEGKDRTSTEHNLGLFEMLNGEYAAAVAHFESALKFWVSEHIPLLEEIDTWNLALALQMIGKNPGPGKQKGRLFDVLGKRPVSPELRLFLIRQFADSSDLFGDKSASTHWLERGIKDSAKLEDFFEIALYFEARLGSFDILGSNNEQQNSSLSKAQAMRENCCTTLGDTENFMVVIEKKFYLLREGLTHSKGQIPPK
jgi:hypothetical protein